MYLMDFYDDLVGKKIVGFTTIDCNIAGEYSIISHVYVTSDHGVLFFAITRQSDIDYKTGIDCEQKYILDEIVTEYDRYRLLTSKKTTDILRRFGISHNEIKQYLSNCHNFHLYRHIDELHNQLSNLQWEIHESLCDLRSEK